MNSIDKSLTKLKDFEPIDVLVNNAGHGYRAAIEEGKIPVFNSFMLPIYLVPLN